MNTKRLQILIGLVLITMLLAACGGGQAAVAPTDSSPAATASPDEELAAKTDEYFTKLVKDIPFSGAVLLARGDDIILSQGYGLADVENEIAATAETPFYIAEMTYIVTAAAVMQLQEQGKLNVSDPICNYLDECPEAWEPITIHHLLSGTSGLAYEYPFNPTSIDHTQTNLVPLAESVQAIARQPVVHEPKPVWEYSNNGYLLLGAIIERVSGQSYESYIEDNIFAPLSMDHSGFNAEGVDIAEGYWNLSTRTPVDHVLVRVFYPAVGMYTTVGDLFKFARAMLGGELVSQESLEQMTQPHADIEINPDLQMGYSWYMGEFEGFPFIEYVGTYEGYASRITIFPQDDVTEILLSNRDANFAIWRLTEYPAKWALGIQ